MHRMVRIRLMRKGATKRPAYRVVVADSRSPRDGRFIENIGRYQPLEDPSLIEINEDRALYWLAQGAQPSEQVAVLLKVQGIWEKFEATRKAPPEKAEPKKAAPKKAQPVVEPEKAEAEKAEESS
jgi:small subunit ribosomal protein S16